MSAAEPPRGANSAPAWGSAAAKPPAWGGHTSSASDAMEPATVSRPSGNAAPPTVGAAAWHVISTAQTAEQLGSAVDGGLTAAEASQRLGVHGPNEIREQAQRSPWRMFFGQFTDFMIVLLIAAAVISGFIGEIEDAAAILAIVVLNAVIGFVQEYRAEKALRALKQLAALKARVIRDHAIVTVPAVDLVPGDLVLLEAGSVIPADLRMIASAQLRIEEAALTGESHPIEKQTEALTEADLALGDRINMAYSGTIATYGRGQGIVVATGMTTELGKIATLLDTTEEVRTPLQKRLARFGKQLSVIAIAIVRPRVRARSDARRVDGADVPHRGKSRRRRRSRSPARGHHHRARARRAADGQKERPHSAAAGGGDAGIGDYICSDKTGTLTQNRMRADTFVVAGPPQQRDANRRRADARPVALVRDGAGAFQ